MASKKELSFFCVIPAPVILDKELMPNAKLLYGLIAGLENEKGYCWAKNSYFEKSLNCSKDTIIRMLNSLEQKGFIGKEIIYSKQNPSQVIERHLYVKLGVRGE